MFLQLRIRTIPSLIIFQDGVAVEKLLGFEGLSDTMPEGKEDEWATATLAKLLAQKNAINKALVVDEEEVEKQSAIQMENLRKAMIADSLLNLDDDDDLEEA